MPTPGTVDLTQLSSLAEIIIRGGDLHDTQTNVRQILSNNYRVYSTNYGVYGLSVIINANPAQPATYDQLAQRNPILNKKLSVSVMGTVKGALRRAGFGMLLYVTPSGDLPDHHTLAVFDWDDEKQSVHHVLPDAAAAAIITAFSSVVENPYPKSRP